MGLAAVDQIILDSWFTWDNGRGETRCSADYLERRNFQRIALGRAAEARLLGKMEAALGFEKQAYRLGEEMDEMQQFGHVGESRVFHPDGIRVICVNTRAQDLKLV